MYSYMFILKFIYFNHLGFFSHTSTHGYSAIFGTCLQLLLFPWIRDATHYNA